MFSVRKQAKMRRPFIPDRLLRLTRTNAPLTSVPLSDICITWAQQ